MTDEVIKMQMPSASDIDAWDLEVSTGGGMSDLLGHNGKYKAKLVEAYSKKGSQKNSANGKNTNAVFKFQISEKGPDLGKRVMRYIGFSGVTAEGVELTPLEVFRFMVRLGADPAKVKESAKKSADKPIDVAAVFKNYIGKEFAIEVTAEASKAGKFAGKYSSSFTGIVSEKDYKLAEAVSRLKEPLPDDAQTQYDAANGGKKTAATNGAPNGKANGKAAPVEEDETPAAAVESSDFEV